MTLYDPALTYTLATAQAALVSHTDTGTATMQANQLGYTCVLQQARLWAFVDNFRLFDVLTLVCIPLIFLLPRMHHPPLKKSP